jgi:5-dehydro-4-deoxyglucarate dehydratase
MPPYLVQMPQRGLLHYVTAVTGETGLDAIVYHRGIAQLTEESAARRGLDPAASSPDSAINTTPKMRPRPARRSPANRRASPGPANAHP